MKSRIIVFLASLLITTSLYSFVGADIRVVTAADQPILIAQQGSAEQIDTATKEGFVPCGNTKEDPCTIAHLFAGFVVIINYLIASTGFIAIAMIIYAGLMMILARGNETQLKSAKGRLTGAITGVVLVSAAYVLINSVIAGSLGLGVKDGAMILTDPKGYIQRASVKSSDVPMDEEEETGSTGTKPTSGKGSTSGTSKTETSTNSNTASTGAGGAQLTKQFICINRSTGAIAATKGGGCTKPFEKTTSVVNGPMFCVYNKTESSKEPAYYIPLTMAATQKAECTKKYGSKGMFSLSDYKPQ